MHRLGSRFPKMSLNRLLSVWLCIALPVQTILIWPLHQPGPGLLAGVLLWIALRHLNRLAWKRHFTPKGSTASSS